MSLVAHVPTAQEFAGAAGADPRPALATGRFGPVFWAALEDCVESLPERPTEAQQDAWLQLLGALVHLLPCGKCQSHFEAYQAEHPPPPKPFSREAASLWLWTFHNAVSARTGRPEMLRGEQQARWLRRARYPRVVLSYEDAHGRPRDFTNSRGYTAELPHSVVRDYLDGSNRLRGNPHVTGGYITESVGHMVIAIAVLVAAILSFRAGRARRLVQA